MVENIVEEIEYEVLEIFEGTLLCTIANYQQ
jgi:hypothetical protein